MTGRQRTTTKQYLQHEHMFRKWRQCCLWVPAGCTWRYQISQSIVSNSSAANQRAVLSRRSVP